ncbi:MAG: hypothetical protein QXH37_00180 [Candidatus Bathyarchaeia archaeon]
MVEEANGFKVKFRKIAFRALKTALKGVIFYTLYLVLLMFLAPATQIIPAFQQTIETFFMIYLALMIVGELTSGTILQHFFNTAKALFIILYLILALGSGIVNLTFQGLNVLVDIRIFLIIAMLLSLLGLAKSTLQAINYLGERAEHK